MAIAAHLHLIFPQQPQDLRALIPLVQRRVVKKAQLLVISRRLQGRLQPSDLPQQDLFVVGALVIQLIEPAPGTAQSRVPVEPAGRR